MTYWSVIEKIKRSETSLSEEETLAIAKILSRKEDMENYRVVVREMFEDDSSFNTFLHNFLCVWAKIRSSDGIEIPTYDPFAIGYARGVKDKQIEIWVSWYSNCIIIHIEKETEDESCQQSTWLLIDLPTYEQIKQDANVLTAFLQRDQEDGAV